MAAVGLNPSVPSASGNAAAAPQGGGAQGPSTSNEGGIFTNDEFAMMKDMTPAEKKRFELQRTMEEHTQNVTLLSTLQKLKHDAMMAIIQDIK